MPSRAIGDIEMDALNVFRDGMKEQVEEFIANLLRIGFNREQVSIRGYDYALALQTDMLPKEQTYVSSKMMAEAARLVKNALPEAYRIYERRNRTW